MVEFAYGTLCKWSKHHEEKYCCLEDCKKWCQLPILILLWNEPTHHNIEHPNIIIDSFSWDTWVFY